MIMMNKTFYTFWVKNPFNEEMILLEDEPFYYLRWKAFRHAKKLLKRLKRTIYVRRITYGNDMCLEWEYPYVDESKVN